MERLRFALGPCNIPEVFSEQSREDSEGEWLCGLDLFAVFLINVYSEAFTELSYGGLGIKARASTLGELLYSALGLTLLLIVLRLPWGLRASKSITFLLQF